MKKHILFLTWKDVRHPRAGGAEKVMLEYASRLAKDGHKVTWFASSFPGALKEETIQDIQIIRKYHLYTIYFFSWIWYKKFIRTNPVDIIIDEAGGVPLLSLLYEKKIPIYFFIHHIGEKEFNDEFPGPIGYIAKKVIFGIFSLYKNLPTITVSDSTKKELQDSLGFSNVRVIENALSLRIIDKINWEQKKKEIVFLGRYTPIKRIEDSIKAFEILHKTHPEYRLKIIGNPQDQKYTETLTSLVNEKNLNSAVSFIEYSENDISYQLAQSEIMLISSKKEGFGLIVLEGNASGIPVIAYDVAGLRDSVIDGENGVLVPSGDYTAMGGKLITFVEDRELLTSLSESSLQYIKTYPGWDERYTEFKKIILL